MLLLAPALLWAAPEHGPSTPNPLNCAADEESSNYTLPTWPKAEAEVHVVGVGKGRYGDMAVAKARGALGAVRVVLHKTRRPAILVLSAAEPTLWELKLMREASLKEVLLQGPGVQTVRGLPSSVPVSTRAASALPARWERGGKPFELGMRELRCLTGLREASFQGCSTGLAFEVPHYRQDDAASSALDGLPDACPKPAPAKDAKPLKPPQKIRIAPPGT